MNTVLLLFLFIALLILIEVSFRAIRSWKDPERRLAEKRLKQLTRQRYEIDNINLVKKIKYSDIPLLDSFFSRFSVFGRMIRSLEQADIKESLSNFILMTIMGIAIGLFLMKVNLLLGILVTILSMVLPSGYVYFKKRKRMKKFEKQLPDTMDLIARSLKAGLAFSGALKIVADEFPDPVGLEFSKTVNEINFGISSDEALRNLASRIECPDLKFFVISVILQKQTGGNLAEILENIGRLVRDRFKFQGKVRALSAEGRISAYILVLFPFILAGIISLLNPEYMTTLKDEAAGNVMVIVALILMVIGSISLTKMIKLKI